VLWTAAVIQRCQIHKARNLQALLPKARQAHVRATLRRAYRAASADPARRQLKALGSWLESNGHVDAASLREGLEETLTVQRARRWAEKHVRADMRASFVRMASDVERYWSDEPVTMNLGGRTFSVPVTMVRQ